MLELISNNDINPNVVNQAVVCQESLTSYLSVPAIHKIEELRTLSCKPRSQANWTLAQSKLTRIKLFL